MNKVKVTWEIPLKLREKLASIAKVSKKTEDEIVAGLIEAAIEDFEVAEWLDS